MERTLSKVDSRAVSMIMHYNDMADCHACGETMIYVQATDNIWVVANVYVDCEHWDKSCRKCGGTMRRWDHVEHWHSSCYDAEGQPYGEAMFKKTTRMAKANVNKD